MIPAYTFAKGDPAGVWEDTEGNLHIHDEVITRAMKMPEPLSKITLDLLPAFDYRSEAFDGRRYRK